MIDQLLHRRRALALLGLASMTSLVGCGRQNGSTQTGIVLNVEMYSYLDHAAVNIIFNRTDLGVMSAYGGTGTITGVWIPFGPQSLKWTLDGPKGTPGIGTIVEIKNRLTITPEQIPQGTRYIGLHLYPGDTAEATFSDGIPDRTERGQKIISDNDDHV